jgi:cleavage stimulation factor subunit 3
VFETAVNKFTQKPETKQKAIPLYLFFHHFESNYGELSQVSKLEARIRELFPNDYLDLFAHRFQTTVPTALAFDPTTARPIISMKAQARPKAMPSIEAHQPLSPQQPTNESPAPFSPRPTNAHLAIQDTAPRLSPKRPYQPDNNTVEDSGPPRKLPRGESPFKGAAGRRINAAKANNTATPSLPRDVNVFLSILPRAEESRTLPYAIPTTAMMTIIRHVNLTQLQHQVQAQSQGMQRGGSAQGHQNQQHYGYPQR